MSQFSIYSVTIKQCLRYLDYQFSQFCAVWHGLVHLVLIDTEEVLRES